MQKESLSSSMPKLILAVVLIVCVGAVMGLMGWALTKKQVEVEAPEVKAPAEIVEDKTFDWQTYRNEKFGFKVRYPEDWKIENNILYSSEMYNMREGGLYSLFVTIDSSFNSLDEFLENQKKCVENVANFTINNQKFARYADICNFNVPTKTIIVVENQIVIGTSYSISDESKIINQILSSFKFIDQSDISDWQTYRNEEFGFSVTFDEECKNVWESKTTNYTDGNILAKTDFYFKDYSLHIFSSINIYKKEWFIENSEKRVQYKEWSAENNGTIEEYNKIKNEMKSEFIREKGKIAWLKGDSDGYPLGTYLGENNDYIFVLGIGPNGCMATELLCSLPIRKMTMDSFQIIDTNRDWQTYRNEEFGFEVKYPEDFLSEQVPQPKTEVIQCDYVNFLNNCSTEITTINDMPFCLQKTDKAAAGTRHTTYNYTTVRDQECFVVSFTVAYPSCSNYLPIQSQEIQKVYDKCRLDNEVTKPEIINQIFSSFKFIEK